MFAENYSNSATPGNMMDTSILNSNTPNNYESQEVKLLTVTRGPVQKG